MYVTSFLLLESRLGGSAVVQGSAGGLPALQDGDQDVDLADFAAFQARCR